MIPGERTYLAAVDSQNAEVFARWFGDPETRLWLFSGHLPISTEEERETLQRMAKDETSRHFQIHALEDDRLVGLVSLMKIDTTHRSAEIGVVIGDAKDRGQGLGRDAIVTCLRAGFDVLGLHSIIIWCVEGNEVGDHLYRSIGFTPQGRGRDGVFLRGRFRDTLLFDMLEDEFRERYGPWESE